MTQEILPHIILVGGGPVDTQQLKYWHNKGKLIAVDGGLNRLMEEGFQPERVIGDMDSADPAYLEKCHKAGIPVDFIADQNSTDLEKALRAYPEGIIIGIGFLDGRIDHSLAALHALIHAGGVGRVLLIGACDALLMCQSEITFSLPKEARLSVWPIGKITFSSSAGLVWPLDGLTMEAGIQSGTSNKAMGLEKVTIVPESGTNGHYALLTAMENWTSFYDALISG